MKKFVVIFLLGMVAGTLKAQDFHTIKTGVGYTHDFPGMNGYTVSGEYIFPLVNRLQGGMGLKFADMQGYPRTNQVMEFTRAQTIDFSVYWVPLQTESSLFRVGIGYSFSFFSIKRTDPVLVDNGNGKTLSWPVSYEKGRVAGFNAIAEYEYSIPGSAFTIGIRGGLYKIYDQSLFVGPMLGFRF